MPSRQLASCGDPWASSSDDGCERKKLCLIPSGSSQLRPLDVHSFPRAYNTALADANVQTAMRLAGHRNASTHLRYGMWTGILTTPVAALPSLRDLGIARAQKLATQQQSDPDPRNTNGTVTVGQSAVLLRRRAGRVWVGEPKLQKKSWVMKDLNLQPMD
jgi:hypothetical protein